MYAVISGDTQIAVLQWTQGDPASFLVAFRAVVDVEGDEPYDAYDVVELALDLFSRKYAVLESSTFDLKFVRLLLPE